MKLLKVTLPILLLATTCCSTGSLQAESDQHYGIANPRMGASNDAASNNTGTSSIPPESNSDTLQPENSETGSLLTTQEVKILIDLHNKVRADVNVEPVSWSIRLALFAQQWADHLASTHCQMEHRPREGKWKQEYGENLFIGTSAHYSVADAVTSWESEKKYYNGDPINSSNYLAIGHYTQIIWRNTKQIGCATAKCNDNMIVVCNYDPPGNFSGQKPY